jgi:hypothetical protein
VAVIVLPLYVPPVIFGAGALDALAGGLPWTGGLFLLLAYSAGGRGPGPDRHGGGVPERAGLRERSFLEAVGG